MSHHPRIIIASPDPVECGALADWLSDGGFEPVRRSDPKTAAAEIQTRPFDLLIADELFVFRHQLHELARARKPAMPTVVIGDGASAARCESMGGQFIYLTRPAERGLLICTVSMAIEDGRPVRRSVRKPVPRFRAIANGVPSYIIDVSNDGLCLEMPRDRRSPPLPYFNVVVPLIGVAVTFQRVWTKPISAERTAALWCGGALVRNQARTEQSWRVVVDALSAPGTASGGPLGIQ
jgi:hypothetical protein